MAMREVGTYRHGGKLWHRFVDDPHPVKRAAMHAARSARSPVAAGFPAVSAPTADASRVVRMFGGR